MNGRRKKQLPLKVSRATPADPSIPVFNTLRIHFRSWTFSKEVVVVNHKKRKARK